MTDASQQLSENPLGNSRSHIIILMFLVILITGSAGYLLGTRKNTHPSSTIQVIALPTKFIVRPSSAPSLPAAMRENWQTYTDATLGAMFKYPTTWKVTRAGSDTSISGSGSDYTLVLEDSTEPRQRVSIYISSYNNPENLSLADFYRKYFPGGAERYANVSFQETVNSYGIRFEKIVQPYISPDYNDSLQTVHNKKVYEITKTITFQLSSNYPFDMDYHRDPKFQRAIAEYNQLVNSFSFLQ
jgi:hypothetical protein